jgi:hypothetical protein
MARNFSSRVERLFADSRHAAVSGILSAFTVDCFLRHPSAQTDTQTIQVWRKPERIPECIRLSPAGATHKRCVLVWRLAISECTGVIARMVLGLCRLRLCWMFNYWVTTRFNQAVAAVPLYLVWTEYIIISVAAASVRMKRVAFVR